MNGGRLAAVLREEMLAWGAPRLQLACLVARLLPLGGAGRLRRSLLTAGGLRLGPRTVVLGTPRFTGQPDPTRMVQVGADVTINYGCVFDVGASITIGDNVGIGQDVLLLTNRHELREDRERRMGGVLSEPIVVHDGAWLSTRAVVLPGVTIGRGAVVAAGAVVTQDVPAHQLVGGVPARRIRDLDVSEPA